MDFLQTYPQIAEYIEEFNYFTSTDVVGRLKFIHEHPMFEMAILGVLGYAGFLLYKEMYFKGPKNPWTFGKRHWATMEEARNMKMLVKKPSGSRIILAKMGDEWLEAEIHATVFGSNGTGKGASIIIPNLLTWKGSVIVNDVKGENYVISNRYRRENLNQPVFVIDPYGEVTDETNCFNPLDYVTNVDEANILAEILFPVTEGGNAFFEDGARGLISTTCMYIKTKYPPEQQNLGMVRDLLTFAPAQKMEIFLDMQQSEEFDGAIRKGINQLLELGGTPMNPKPVPDEVAQAAPPNETLLDMYATTNIALKIFDDKKICHVLSKSDMQIHMLKYIPQTIYLVMSASHLKVSGIIMKLIYSYAINFMASSARPVEAAEQGLETDESRPTLFLLDEFAQLKKFLPVKDMMPLGRSYLIRFLTILQGQKQLDEYYKDGGADFIVNATKVYLGAEDNDTAEEISKFCGDTTIRCDTMDLATKKKSVGWQGVKLITPGDAFGSDPEEPFIFKGKNQPMRGKQARFFKDPFFKGKWDKYKAG